MAAPLTTPPPPTNDILTLDIPCSKCTYNLRALSPLSNCPECGHPIPLSISHHNAALFTPEQRASLAGATTRLAISVWMTTGTLPLVALLAYASTGNGHEPLIILCLWILVEHILWATAAPFLGLPGHLLQHHTRWPRRHRWNGTLAILDPLFLAIVLLMLFTSLAPGTIDLGVYLTAFLAAAVVFICRGGSVLLTGLWLLRLGRQLHFRQLNVHAWILTIAFVGINTIWAFCSLVTGINIFGHASCDVPLAIAAYTAVPTLLLFAPWAAIILTLFARRFHKLPNNFTAALP